MPQTIELTAADGHRSNAYRVDPESAPRAGLVVVQEIFGVNAHIRGVCDGYAAEGYAVVAPALFDRVRSGVEIGYEPADIEQGRALKGQVSYEQAVMDVAAAVESVRGAGKVGVVGYCWGGSVAWLAACRLPVDAAVGYYGGQIAEYAEEQPEAPVMLHFGDSDASIPIEAVDKVRAGHPDVPVHVYHAGHGFNCDMRKDYHPESSKLARERTLAFFAEHLGA